MSLFYNSNNILQDNLDSVDIENIANSIDDEPDKYFKSSYDIRESIDELTTDDVLKDVPCIEIVDDTFRYKNRWLKFKICNIFDKFDSNKPKHKEAVIYTCLLFGIIGCSIIGLLFAIGVF